MFDYFTNKNKKSYCLLNLWSATAQLQLHTFPYIVMHMEMQFKPADLYSFRESNFMLSHFVSSCRWKGVMEVESNLLWFKLISCLLLPIY